MGGSESTVWDRYVPTPPPGEDRNDDQRQKQAKTNTSDTQPKQPDKSNKNEEKVKATKNNENEKAKQTTKANTADNKIKQETEPKANDVKDEQPMSKKEKEKKQSNSEENPKKKHHKLKADTDNTQETERAQITSNEGRKRPQMKRGVERKDIDDELAYDPMANFLERKEVNKDKSRVNDDMFMIRKKPLGPRWKPKVAIRNEGIMPDTEHNSENKHIPKSIGTSAGPERRPKMKVGYMIDDLDQGRYSLHGNFVLSPVQTNIAWADP